MLSRSNEELDESLIIANTDQHAAAGVIIVLVEHLPLKGRNIHWAVRIPNPKHI